MSQLPISLRWSGRAEPEPTPSTALLPRVDGEGPALLHGDNCAALAALLPSHEGQATLVYGDPPFFTGREHHAITRTRQGGEIHRAERAAFDDRWADLGTYLGALERSLRLMYRLLAPHGSLVIHVDPKTSHYVKVLCDELFGVDAFASEIVWRYRRWPAKTPNYQRMHDVLLRYVRDPQVKPRFNQLYEPLAASTQATWGTGKQRAVVDGSGRRRRSSTTDEPSPGTPLGDVWEIGIVAPVAKERTGYPTQKPLALLRRLVESLTDPGELVVDPFAGSGTTLEAALALGRRALGVDASAEAIEVATRRLRDAGYAPSVHRCVPGEGPSRARPRPAVSDVA